MAIALAALCGCGKRNQQSDLVQTYAVTGIVREVHLDASKLVVEHLEVPGYMPAMRMPFHVINSNLLTGIGPGDSVIFDLKVTADESWIDAIKPAPATIQPHRTPASRGIQPASAPSEMYTFTNELGRETNLADFRGKALALTFIFTRCPVPDYCPRLSKNFAEAAELLAARSDGPTNWHFLSVTIDPDFDSPAVLKSYGESYNYDPNHWSFLTGPKDRIANLARMFGFEYEPDGASFNHGFRTVIINSSNKVEKIYPVSGNLSDQIAADLLKAVQPQKD